MNTVFFVIPVYNVEKYLDRCVQSVLRQTYKNIRVILIDDGSRDNSGKICDEYEKKHSEITVIHKENGGLSDARNKGIELALSQGDGDDWIVLLDSDDFVKENFAERLVSLCNEYDASLCQSEYEKGSGDNFSEATTPISVNCQSANDAILGYQIKSQSTPKLYRLSLFETLRFPKGVWNEDEFVTYKAVYNSKNIVFTTEKLYYYYQHPDSIMSHIAKKLKNNPHKWDWLEAYKERIAFFEEKGEKDQVLKTHEKICTDIILRYCEQMYVPKKDRDEDAINGKYISMYRENFKIMIKRKRIPFKRKMMYIAFYLVPMSGVIMGKIFTLRK